MMLAAYLGFFPEFIPSMDLGFRVLGCRVLGFRALRFTVLGFSVPGLRFRALSLGFRAYVLGLYCVTF